MTASTVANAPASASLLPPAPTALDAAELRRLCLDAGADDVGFVGIDRPEVADQRDEIRWVFPRVRTLVSFVAKMRKDNVRSPARSVANREFHATDDEVAAVSRAIAERLEARGVGAVYASMGFPMEMDRWPGKVWPVAHKPIAEAAGLGKMGIHRNVIHPKFGNFILLGTVLIDADVDEPSAPLDFNPCLECKLCVAACPVGAIGQDGAFDFSACYTHNYREFMGGFANWVATVADAKDAAAYRARFTDAETVSMWQSLAYGPNYKAAYCMAVCPAGEDVIGPYLADKPGFLAEIVRPLQAKEETIYVTPGSDAERHVARRFPRKHPKRVSNGLRIASARNFLAYAPRVFQRGRAAGLDAVFHFTFTGDEAFEGTITIRDGRIRADRGLAGTADVRVTTDSATWVRFLNKEASILWALARRRIRVKGPLRLLRAFERCFPR